MTCTGEREIGGFGAVSSGCRLWRGVRKAKVDRTQNSETVKESVDNLSFPSMLLESQIPPKPPAKRLILKFFPRDFLSMRMTGHLGRDVINGRSKRCCTHSASLF